MASSLVLSRKKRTFIYISTERTGPGFSAFEASAGRPASLKNATSDVISSQPIACFLPNNEAGHVIHRTDHEAGHVFSPTRKDVSAFSELTSTVIPVPALQTRPCCR